MEQLNPKSKVLANLMAAPSIIERIDEHIEDASFEGIALGISRILKHCETDRGDLCEFLKADGELGALTTICLFNAATELQTGFNVLRLGNIPAVYRQYRVSLEFIATACIMVLPIDKLKRLSPKLKLVQKLTDHPNKRVCDLVAPSFKEQGKIVQRKDPILKGDMFLDAFYSVCQDILEISESTVNNMRMNVLSVYHPASHGSLDSIAFHFEAVEVNLKAGAMYSEERASTYKRIASDWSIMVTLLADILDASYTYLSKSRR